MKIIRVVFVIGLTVLFLTVSTSVWAQEEEEEEPIQARPNPMEKTTKTMDRSRNTSLRTSTSKTRQNVRTALRSKLNAMGFQTGVMKKTGKNSWSVEVKGFSSNKASASLKGSISWDPFDSKKQTGTGKLMIEVDEDGFLTISNQSLSAMGYKANSAKLKQIANIH